MGNCFLYGNGGSNPLNFEIAIGTTQPSKPKENIIWLNTGRKVTGWYFSVTEPTNMAEGEVWFVCGESSNVEFNALKKNAIRLYPKKAKQRVSGELVEVTAKTYQKGAWVDWTIEYFLIPGSGVFDAVYGVTKQGDGSYEFWADRRGNMVVPFDATEYKTMRIKGSFQGFKGDLWVGLFAAENIAEDIYTFLKGYSNGFADGGGTIDGTYDVSESKNVYVGVCCKQDHEEPQHLHCTLTEIMFST